MKQYQFLIEMTNIWNNEREILNKFKTIDIKKGMQKSREIAQQYINNGTVNDYTSFTSARMIIDNKKYTVTGWYNNKLIFDEYKNKIDILK